MAAQIDSSAKYPEQHEYRWLIVILFCCIAVRLFLFVFRSADLNTDPDAYVALAENTVQNGGFCKPGSTIPTAYRPPVYPLLLSGFLWLGVKTSVAVAIINLAASAGIIIASWWTARAVGLNGVWPPVIAASAGMDPLLLRYSLLPMTEVLSGALVSVAVLNAVRLRAERDLSEDTQDLSRKDDRAAVICGVFLGLAALCRPCGSGHVCCRLSGNSCHRRYTTIELRCPGNIDTTAWGSADRLLRWFGSVAMDCSQCHSIRPIRPCNDSRRIHTAARKQRHILQRSGVVR